MQFFYAFTISLVLKQRGKTNSLYSFFCHYCHEIGVNVSFSRRMPSNEFIHLLNLSQVLNFTLGQLKLFQHSSINSLHFGIYAYYLVWEELDKKVDTTLKSDVQFKTTASSCLV